MTSTNRILVINPNSNSSMTDSLRQPIEALAYNNTIYTYLTAPSHSPSSINDLSTAADSTVATLPLILPLLGDHDAFLIACYSPHPLVTKLKEHTFKPVIGIFEASVSTALSLLDERQAFAIVSTGDVWKQILGDAVRKDLLGVDKARRVFAGVETLGLSAGELHGEGAEEGVRQRVKAAARRSIELGSVVLGKEVSVILLGCAGMVGMEYWVKEEVGRAGRRTKIVDGVKAGIGILQGILRGQL